MISTAAVTDGTGTTLMVVEPKAPIPWTNPRTSRSRRPTLCSEMGSNHPGGFDVSMADGSVRFFTSSINPETLRTMVTRNVEEVVAAP